MDRYVDIFLYFLSVGKKPEKEKVIHVFLLNFNKYHKNPIFNEKNIYIYLLINHKKDTFPLKVNRCLGFMN